MRAPRTYLDWNASAPLRPEARAAMLSALDLAGNPSAVHAEGRAARAAVEAARAEVAALAGCQPDEIVFTSGATEAAAILSRLGRAVEVQATAHDCLWENRSEEGRGRVYAMGVGNGETGAVTEPPARVGSDWPCPSGEVAEMLLLDLAQVAGRRPFAFSWSGAELAILSAHKFGGPKGVGALIVRQGTDVPALQSGGGQETSRRSGTENVAGIAGMGAAASAAARELDAGRWDDVARLRNLLETTLAAEVPETILVGKDGERLPNTACLATPGWKGETQVMQMDLAGFAVSAGSACSSGKVRERRVLRAMGLDDAAAASAIRVSLGPETSESEVLRFCEAWIAQHRKFRARAA